MAELVGEQTAGEPRNARPGLYPRDDGNAPAAPPAFIGRKVVDEPDSDAAGPRRKVIYEVNPYAALVGGDRL